MDAQAMVEVAETMVEQGVKPDAHHTKIRLAYQKITGEKLQEVQPIRDLLQEMYSSASEEAPKAKETKRASGKSKRAPKAKETPSRREKKVAEPWTLSRYHEEYPDRTHVTGIVETSEKNGRPTVVEITCVVSGEKRQIKAQDAFQVKTSGKPEHLKAYRNGDVKTKKAASPKATRKTKKGARKKAKK